MEPIELTDGVVVLQAPGPRDVDRVTEACQDPDVQEWTIVPRPYRREHAVWFVEELVAPGWAADTERTWAVRVQDRLVGMVGLTRQPSRAAELGYWLAPEARGQGVLHRSLALVLDHAFDDDGMDLDRVDWRCYAGNWRSWRAVWRHGFRFEGVRRAGAVQRDVRRDEWCGGLLRGEPREPVAPWPATTVPAPAPGHDRQPRRAREPHATTAREEAAR